ncbi:hypothetical protein NA56DRAFT_652540 [Hyaloscypha hepaticicola]|uniref:C2H2-type domain-containing protein n=1 Tax=Hyaloscypha hepaticicola TaxID=2082293 RepID=A0A2J6PEF7_9HELO|nr:hypothetical protein NA56DRAFT_652540 [Hyaloscypha hepaticicola]
MPPAALSPSDLLHYIPAHRVLICKECRYAIQPSAISRHLKDLHKIYRSDRSELLEYTKKLDLADPADVVLPLPNEAPVPLLPTESGLVCARDGCNHLCITVKRMKSHWATAHRDVVGSASSQWRIVTLQTFFRGNQLRYFIVSPQHPHEPQQEPSPASQSEPESRMSETTAPSEWSESCSPVAEIPNFPADWIPDDVALFKHFMTSTFYYLGYGPKTRQLWKTTVPEMAFQHDFLKHGILACSALHLAHLNPSERRQYQLIAACHQARGLPRFREAIAAPTEDNCHAIMAFSHLLIVHCFAAEDADAELLLVSDNPECGIPDWLKVIRGSCAVFREVWGHMSSGPFKPLIEESAVEEALPIIPDNPEHSARLKELLTLPVRGENPPVVEILDHQITAYSSALILLSRAFVMAQAAKDHGNFTMWTAVQIWPARLPIEYLDLLRAREPAALVLLAHYCVLLGPLEESWFMSSFRKRLLERIYWQLDESWRCWLDWPFSEAGLMPPGQMQCPMEGLLHGDQMEGCPAST